MEKKFLVVNACSCTERKRNILICESGRHKKILAGKKQNIDPMWKVLFKEVDLGEPTSFLDHVYWGFTQRHCEKKAKIFLTITEPCSNPEFPQGATEKQPRLENT